MVLLTTTVHYCNNKSRLKEALSSLLIYLSTLYSHWRFVEYFQNLSFKKSLLTNVFARIQIDLFLSYLTTLFLLQRLYSIEQDGKMFIDNGLPISRQIPAVAWKNWTTKASLRTAGRHFIVFFLVVVVAVFLWSRVLLGKLIVAQLARNFLAFYGNKRLITVFKRTRYWTLSCASWVLSTSSHSVSL